MDISSLKLTEIINMLYRKIMEMTNMTDLSKIDWSNITSAIISTLLIVLFSSFILWLLKSIGLYKIAKNRGDQYAFLAFIPYFCLFTAGKIVGKTKIFGIEITHPEYLLPAIVVSMMFPLTAWIASLLFLFFYFAILYRIYQLQAQNFAIVMLILSIILPFLQPFFLFFIRDNASDPKAVQG